MFKQNKRRKGLLGPGGGLYLFTLEDSKDWNYGKDNQGYRWGISESESESPCEDRLKKHAQQHPFNKIEICGLWRHRKLL